MPRSRRSASWCGLRACGRSTPAGLDNARLLERLTAFQVELSQRYDLDYVSSYDARVVERVRLAPDRYLVAISPSHLLLASAAQPANRRQWEVSNGIGITHKFKGGTKQQYDASIAVVHLPDGLPEGQIHHRGRNAGRLDRGRNPRFQRELGAISQRDTAPRLAGAR